MRDTVRDQFAAARRAQILDAALQLFASKGYNATTIRDIAHAAGLADGTVYLYFENKAALLFGVLDRAREAVARDDPAAAHDTADPRDFLRTYLRTPLAAPQADNFALFRIILSEIMVNDAMRERYSKQLIAPDATAAGDALRRWAERHDLPAPDAELATHILAALVLGLIVARIAGDELLAARWNELPDLLADLLLAGLAGGRPERDTRPSP